MYAHIYAHIYAWMYTHAYTHQYSKIVAECYGNKKEIAVPKGRCVNNVLLFIEKSLQCLFILSAQLFISEYLISSNL